MPEPQTLRRRRTLVQPRLHILGNPEVGKIRPAQLFQSVKRLPDVHGVQEDAVLRREQAPHRPGQPLQAPPHLQPACAILHHLDPLRALRHHLPPRPFARLLFHQQQHRLHMLARSQTVFSEVRTGAGKRACRHIPQLHAVGHAAVRFHLKI